MPRRQPRRDAGRPRGEAVRLAVLDAAVAELSEHGAAGFSVERVAEAAEVNKTSVYRRWRTREALVAAALAHTADTLSIDIVDTGSLTGDLRAVAAQIAALNEGPTGRAIVEAAVSGAVDDELGEIVQARLTEAATAPMSALVQRAMERGEWSPAVPPTVLFGALSGALIHRAFFEHQPLDDAFLDELIALLVFGASGAR
jgi:AcrR family transcriptional regulator